MPEKRKYIGETPILPSKPNSLTGKPWPPLAPRIGGILNGVGRKRHCDKPWESDVDSVALVDGSGPEFARFDPPRLKYLSWAAGSAVVVLLAVILTLLYGIFVIINSMPWNATFNWMALWFMWPILAINGLWYAYGFRRAPCSAGVEWLKQGADWVYLYDLVKISASKNTTGAINLNLRDSSGRILRIGLESLVQNQAVWDLAYNGMLHSLLIGDATASKRTRKLLQFPKINYRSSKSE